MILKKKDDRIKEEINRLLEVMENTYPGTEEYYELANDLEKLIQISNARKGNRLGISSETLLKIGFLTFQSLLVLNYEKVDVITTKAWNIIPRIRL